MILDWRLALMALIPKNHLSRWVGWAVRRPWPFGLHTQIRDTLIRLYRIDVDEAEFPLSHYSTFGQFFIRKLKPSARLIAPVSLISPVDGLATLRGPIQAQGRLLQAKGIEYALSDFLPPGWQPEDFSGGTFITIYLAPYNYHRIHSPCESEITRISHVPGALWPVNSWSVRGVRDLFVRNERVLVGCEHPQGKVVVAMIGATNVGRITLDAIPGFCANSAGITGEREIPLPGGRPLPVAKAGGLGCFEMGSTVVLLLSRTWSPKLLPWVLEDSPRKIRLGEAMVGE